MESTLERRMLAMGRRAESWQAHFGREPTLVHESKKEGIQVAMSGSGRPHTWAMRSAGRHASFCGQVWPVGLISYIFPFLLSRTLFDARTYA